MSRDSTGTLAHPFISGMLETPADSQRVLFLGAGADAAQFPGLGRNWRLVQGFRPDFLALQRAGCPVTPEAEGDGYDVALILTGRHRGQNEGWLAEAIRRTVAGGLVVVAGGKTDGIVSLKRRLEQAVPVTGSVSKHHGTAFWFENDAQAGIFAQEIATDAVAKPLVDGRFETAAGMFSHEHADIGSKLLADCLPAGLSGAGADFCAGWGYLAVALAERAPRIATIDLYEADFGSVQAAGRNLATLAPDRVGQVLWQDLVREPVDRRYDVIVMNPPFHSGRAAEPDLGKTLIGVAAKALRPRGELFLVANRQLPYEAVLGACFSRCERLRDEAGFKVFRARR